MAAGSRHDRTGSPTRRSLVRELEAAQALLWEVDQRRHALDDLVWQLIKDGPHSEREYLTAKLDLAHAHMVSRDIAERAVLATVEAPRPARLEAERARGLLSRVLYDYGWHTSSFESTLRLVQNRLEEVGQAGPTRRARRSPSWLACAISPAGTRAANTLPPSSRSRAARQ